MSTSTKSEHGNTGPAFISLACNHLSAEPCAYCSCICHEPLRQASPLLLAALRRWERFMRDNYTPEEISFWGETIVAIKLASGLPGIKATTSGSGR